jgi:hypothetical protein
LPSSVSRRPAIQVHPSDQLFVDKPESEPKIGLGLATPDFRKVFLELASPRHDFVVAGAFEPSDERFYRRLVHGFLLLGLLGVNSPARRIRLQGKDSLGKGD